MKVGSRADQVNIRKKEQAKEEKQERWEKVGNIGLKLRKLEGSGKKEDKIRTNQAKSRKEEKESRKQETIEGKSRTEENESRTSRKKQETLG